MNQPRREFIVAPIGLAGLGYSLAIGYAVHHKLWAVAAIMFCYGPGYAGCANCSANSARFPPVKRTPDLELSELAVLVALVLAVILPWRAC